MGHKVNPIGLRLTVNRTWDSRWYAENASYIKFLHEDIKIREFINSKLKAAGVSNVIIERHAKKAYITIYASRPGIIIGRKGQDIELLKKQLQKVVAGELVLNIVEVRKPELDANITSQMIAQQIEKRVSFKKAMKRAVQNTLRMGALGIKVYCSGRLAGADIARTEGYKEGRVPLHTIRADIDYGFSIARTKYGVIGVKVWIYRGDIMSGEVDKESKTDSKNVASA